MRKDTAPIAVIGAGIAGLTAARALRDAGREVVLFDKARRPAGRMATRRAGSFAFDHGAQYFTVHDPRFRREVEGWLQEGVVARWKPAVLSLVPGGIPFVRGPYERFVGTPGMSALAGRLAQDLELVLSTRIGPLRREAGWWELRDAEGSLLGRFGGVVLAIPPAQAADLLGDAPGLRAAASSVRMRPCWTVMLGLSERHEVEFDAAVPEHSALGWVARNSSKPGRPPGDAWVLQATHDWSEGKLELEPAQVIERLAGELELRGRARLPQTTHRDAHLWRYALADEARAGRAVLEVDQGLVLAGDWLYGSRIESAWLSGLRAASRLLDSEGLGEFAA